jgi:acyl-CoA thioesterase I
MVTGRPHPAATFFVALLALTLGAACDSSVAPSKPSAQIVAFGDSLVAGVGTTGGNNFVSLLSDRIGISIVNAGRSGDTTGSALNRLQGDVIAREPEVVIVLLGGNDLLQGLPVSQRVSNITSIAQQIRSTGATVILVGLGNDPIDPFNGALPGIASQTGSVHVPGILEGIFGVPALMADSVHPNNAGHKIMADRLEPALRTALAQAIAAAAY